MQDNETKTYITNPIEITAHIDTLVHRRIRGDLKILDEGEVVRVIFLGYEGVGEGSHILLERLVSLGASNRLDIAKDVAVDYTEEGVSFSFESRTIDIEDRDGSIRLAFPGRIIKSQRRRFFRARPAPPPPLFEVVLSSKEISAKCPVTDISAGGIAFLTGLDSNWLKPGMKINLEFTLPGCNTVTVNGIFRSHVLIKSNDPNKRYRCGVEFVGIPERIQDRIVKFVFDCQKEEIKRKRERI